MNDLINKDDAFKAMLSECESTDNKDAKMAYFHAASIILKMPSVNDANRQQIMRRGKWILINSEVKSDEVTHVTYKCSACFGEMSSVCYPLICREPPLFCVHCGAFMDGLVCSNSGGDS